MVPKRRRIETCDGVAMSRWSEVRVAHRHRDRRVAKQLLHGFVRYALRYELTCKGVTERMELKRS